MKMYLYMEMDMSKKKADDFNCALTEERVKYLDNWNDYHSYDVEVRRYKVEIDELDLRTIRRFNKIREVTVKSAPEAQWELYKYGDIKHCFDLEEEDD